MARAEERLQGQALRAARAPISPAQRSSARFTTLMIAPSVLVILVVVAFPLFYSFFLSFTSFTLLKPTANWVGLDNYSRLLATPLFWQAFGNTMLFLFVTINVEIGLGLLISQLIARTARGKSAIRTLLMIPMMFAPVLVGFQFRWFFNDQLGLVNNALLSLGLIQQSIPWLVDRNTAMFSIMVADIWMIMTGGGPAHRTELLWTLINRTAITDSKFALGSAMSFVTVIVTLIFTLYLFRQLLKSRIVE